MTTTTYEDAVEKTIAARNLDEDDMAALVIVFARGMARRMDRAGEKGPSDRLAALYRSAIRDLERYGARQLGQVKILTDRSGAPLLKAIDSPEQEGPLAKFRREQAEREAQSKGGAS